MKILFTFDPFEKNNWNRNQVKNLVANYASNEDSLKAVYVASRAEVNLATAYDVPEKDRYSLYPRRLMEKELKSAGLGKVQPVVISESSLSQTAAVEKLASYAKKDKTDLILISTNAKSLLPRMVFGSFAETLVHTSGTDLIVYHQKTKVGPSAPKNILFAHDYSPKSDEGLLRVCEYARKWNSALTIIHIALPESNIVKVQSKTKKIEKQLIELGISATVLVENSWSGAPALIIKKASEQKCNLIALAANENSDTLLGGHVVRTVLRESKLPTLVVKV